MARIGPDSAIQQFELRGQETLGIGRDLANDMVINHPMVSRFHAQIRPQHGNYVIRDCNSTHGTFVNGQSVTGQRVLRINDVIHIGPCSLTLKDNEILFAFNESRSLRLDAIHLHYQKAKKLSLLKDVSVSIQAGELVAIVGCAGSGLTTLLLALSGLRPATCGMVLVDGTDLYQNFNAYRTAIGYLPQWNILHRKLTVEQTLNFAAQLRLPADITRAERKSRISQVQIDLDLTNRRDLPIQSLSDYEVKRVSLGIELLTQPSMLFIDEITSGLSINTEREMIMLLRKLADPGRTIVTVTHATDLELCDQVVWLTRKGCLAFFGPFQEALQYFGVERFGQIYGELENKRSLEHWPQKYLRSPYYQTYVVNRQQAFNVPETPTTPRLCQQLPGAQTKRISGWRQFWILSKRNLAMLQGDRPGLLRMLAVSPVLGLVNFLIWRRPLFGVGDANPNLAILMLFTTIVVAMIAGSFPTSLIIAKEHNIYRHERMNGLKVIPYVLSKFEIGLLWSVYQSAVFLLFTVIAVPDLLATPTILIGTYFSITLSTLGGTVLGLLGSAIPSPHYISHSFILLNLLIVQIICGGVIFPINALGATGKVLNQLSLIKWPFETLVTLSGLDTDIVYDVNVSSHLFIAAGLIGVLLSLILIVQKLKDFLYRNDPFYWII
ncbi:ATP-binding cassette domain-containing protein [Lyngbya confervoides]|uniref:ATP-binding cassette domain-containing protein n=1 Tax=Lyngbya confervoides BDU141951 TaxID=1574623 RepID=A0ABD4T9D2_9CYAN|nr:ATP-binding cassette domain-containing protein [Lyngbya confervoides]MCM1985398.1 ATP-binding cassette domain-containing protein [Lyngbya confervoides BDU141951]